MSETIKSQLDEYYSSIIEDQEPIHPSEVKELVVTQKAGMWLLGAGALVLAVAALIWSVNGFFLDTDVWLGVRIATGVGVAGILILLGVVIRQQIVAGKSDDFSEVKW